jgi:biotin carboxyl carrier protein
VRVEGRGPLKTVYVDEQPFRVEVPAESGGDELRVLVDARYHSVKTEAGARPRPAAPVRKAAASAPKAAVPGGVPAAMAGRVLKIAVEAGQSVKSGELLLIFEAMKMENEIRSPQDGTVKEIAVKAGDRVNAGDLLLVLQ